MSQFLMRYFLISCFLLSITSCSLSTTKGLLEQTPSKNLVINNYFSDAEKDYVYKAKFNFYKHNFGGILIVKKINLNHHRIVFITEFGNTIFDFEFTKNKFKVNSIIDNLNKKFIINTLRQDLQLLVKEGNKVINKFSNDKEVLYQSDINKQFNYYVFSKESNQLVKIVSASKNKEKMTIYFNQTENEIAKNIEIVHHNFKMKIDLNYISN